MGAGRRALEGPEAGRQRRLAPSRRGGQDAAAMANPADLRRLPRLGLAILCLVHAAVFSWSAAVLPWRGGSLGQVLLGALAALHAVTAVCAVLQHQRALVVAWRVLAAGSLGVLAGSTWAIASAALYLAELYRSLGQALAAALIVVWLVLALFTAPMAVWGVSATAWKPFRRRSGKGAAKGALVASLVAPFGLLSPFMVARGVQAEPVTLDGARVAAALSGALARTQGDAGPRVRRRKPERPSLFTPEPARCPAGVSAARPTVLVSYAARSDGAATHACLQSNASAEPAADLSVQLERLLGERALPGAPVKLDVVTGVHPLAATFPLLDVLKLRPGLDGACAGATCLAPWQLVALDYFTTNRPIPGVKDASFGFSPRRLARALGSSGRGLDGIARIETQSYVVDIDGAHPLERLKRGRQELTPASAARAARAAERHILRALGEDGRFRYLLDPFSGRVEAGNFSVPRQAGTVLVLCELGRQRRLGGAVGRALELLAGYQRQIAAGSVLSDDDRRARLGVTALPLVAFASCREHVGDRYDALIGALAQGLLAFQRPNGDFFPELDLTTGTAYGDHTALYSPGQAVLALVLVEQLAKSGALVGGPSPEVIGAAAQRAMDFFSGPYWRGAFSDFFFLEENWHCLAARAALAGRRHDGYERFCLDYVGFKSRIILDASDGALPEWYGGYGISNLFPPHNTATAGFGEALAAAMAVKQARGLDLQDDRARMRSVLGFLTAAQWDEVSCFACAEPREVVGGFSEHAASPWIRIDYVQHAMAALGHGGRLLAL